MNCPACDHALTEVQVGGLRVDLCHGGCGGIWFDAFELQRVDEPGEDAGERLLDLARDPSLQVDFSRKRGCPRCAGVKLKRHFFSARRRVEVDHCPNCGGYWLDHGELEKIREERAGGLPTRKTQPRITSEMIRYLYRLRIGDQSVKRPISGV
jgi:hypothetical protein